MARGRYEALLLLKLAAAEKAQAMAETDDLAGPLTAKTDALLKWITDETTRLEKTSAPESLGDTAAGARAIYTLNDTCMH